MRTGVSSLIVQAGTCGGLLLVLVVAQCLLVAHLEGRLHDLERDTADLRARYPGGVPDVQSLRIATDAIDQELGEHLYPQLHDLAQQLQVVAGQGQANALHLRLLAAELSDAQADEDQPPPAILPHPIDWATYYLREIDTLTADLKQGRAIDGELNSRLNHLERSQIAIRQAITEAIARKDVLAAMAADPQALEVLRSRWRGLGAWLLCVEHLGLVGLLAVLSLRTGFRLLILLGIPGELRLA